MFFVIKWVFSNNSFTLLTSLNLPKNEFDNFCAVYLSSWQFLLLCIHWKKYYQEGTAMLE